MIMQGTVRGGIYPVTQQAYEEPIDGTRRCKWCGQKFVPTSKLKQYCCLECRTQAISEQHRKACASYRKKMWTPPAEITGKCLICGRELYGKRLKYCSDECAKRGKVERNRAFRAKNRTACA